VVQNGVTPAALVDRLRRWCEARDADGQRHKVLLQLDELGQWIAAGNANDRTMQVQALAEEAAQRGGGRVWLAVTAHGDVQALGGVDLAVRQGEFFGLLGPNGAGKTTLISILAGLVRADSGTAAVLGRDVVTQYREARRLLGVVPQELVFDPFFTVRETLRFQSGYFGLRANGACAVGLKLIKPSLAHISGHEVQHLGVRFKLREQAYWPYEARETRSGKKSRRPKTASVEPNAAYDGKHACRSRRCLGFFRPPQRRRRRPLRGAVGA
jgi:hypothetical protein